MVEAEGVTHTHWHRWVDGYRKVTHTHPWPTGLDHPNATYKHHHKNGWHSHPHGHDIYLAPEVTP